MLNDDGPLNTTCIRGYREGEQCAGHRCVACGREFFCGRKHTCTPRPARVETGIERTLSFAERLSLGVEMKGLTES